MSQGDCRNVKPAASREGDALLRVLEGNYVGLHERSGFAVNRVNEVDLWHVIELPNWWK